MRKQPEPFRKARLTVDGRTSFRRFALLLALVLAALFAVRPVSLSGDVLEYTVGTVALASHGTPDIRPDDIDRVVTLAPERFTYLFRMLQDEIRRGEQDVFPAFARGSDGKVYTVHFFGYPLMAALPFRILDALGQPPFKAFQAVNLAFVFVLGLALYRFFGSARRAVFGLVLFMLSGALLYWTWSSPECVAAAALLSGLLLLAGGRPLAGCLLAGLAAQQNPTIVFFFAFAPFIRATLARMQPLSPVSTARLLISLGLGLAVATLPVLFNLAEYGVPNLIASRFSDVALIGTTRLASFFFDLNQGMLLAIPGVLLALLLARGPALRLLAWCMALTLAMVLPALAVINWNSAAAGPMRYAFWAAMPLLFALLSMLRALARWRAAALAGVLALQVAAMAHAMRYEFVAFSPLASLVLRYAPEHYHPEPEIFAERMAGNDNWVEPAKIYTYRVDGYRTKTLVHDSNTAAAAALCGPGAAPAPDNPAAGSARGWRYLDGPIACIRDGARQYTWLAEDIAAGGPVVLAQGWDAARADVIVSSQPHQQLQVRLPGSLRGAGQAAIVLRGEGARRTRVRVNGHDLGWHALERAPVIVLPAASRGPVLDIALEHDASSAFFLHEVSVRPSTENTP